MEYLQLLDTIWNSPILTDETELHRRKFKDTWLAFIESQGLSQDRSIAIPIGSTAMGIVGPESDFDAIVFTQDPISDAAEGAAREYGMDMQEVVLLTEEGHVPRYFYDDYHVHDAMRDLLLVPDQFIAGNVALAIAGISHLTNHITNKP